MGIMKLGESYPDEIMEIASREAIEKALCSYKYFSIILKQADKKTIKKEPQGIIDHENIRGKSAYSGGGLNA